MAATGASGASFRLDAWQAAGEGPATGSLKDGEDPPHEPMDEADELGAAGELRTVSVRLAKDGEDPPHEPMDEADELTGGGGIAWRELRGFGAFDVSRLVVRPWCPWTERPGLLRTFSCARQLRLDESGFVTIRALLPDDGELVAVALPSSGELAFETDGVLFDGGERLVSELISGQPVRLEADRYYLKLEPSGSAGELRIHVTLD